MRRCSILTSDIAIIGGGASGLACAIEAKRQAKKCGLLLNVTIFEHLNKPAKKILATGNGKCNFTNLIQEDSCYRGTDATFSKKVRETFNVEQKKNNCNHYWGCFINGFNGWNWCYLFVFKRLYLTSYHIGKRKSSYGYRC